MADSGLVCRRVWWIALLLFGGGVAAPQDDRRVQLAETDLSRSASGKVTADDEPKIITEPVPGQEFVFLSAATGRSNRKPFQPNLVSPIFGRARQHKPQILTASGPVFEEDLWLPINPLATTASRDPSDSRTTGIPSARIETGDVPTVIEDGVVIAAANREHSAETALESNRTSRQLSLLSPKHEGDQTSFDDQPWRPLSLAELLRGSILLPRDVLPVAAASGEQQSEPLPTSGEFSVPGEQHAESDLSENAPTTEIPQDSVEELSPHLSWQPEEVEHVTSLPEEINTEITLPDEHVTVQEEIPTTDAPWTLVHNESDVFLEDEEVNLIGAESAVSSRSVIKKAENGVEYEYEYLYYYDDDEGEDANKTTLVEASLFDEEPHKIPSPNNEAVSVDAVHESTEKVPEPVIEVTQVPEVVEEAENTAEVTTDVPESSSTTESTTTTSTTTTAATTTAATTTTQAPQISTSRPGRTRNSLRPSRFRATTEASFDVTTTRLNRFRPSTSTVSTTPAPASSPVSELPTFEVTSRFNRFRNRISTQATTTTVASSSSSSSEQVTEQPSASDSASKPSRGRFRFTTTAQPPRNFDPSSFDVSRRRNPGERISSRARSRLEAARSLLERRTGLGTEDLDDQATEQLEDWTVVPIDFDGESTTLFQDAGIEDSSDILVNPLQASTAGISSNLQDTEERSTLRVIDSDSFRTSSASASDEQSLGRLTFISGPNVRTDSSESDTGNGGFLPIFAVSHQESDGEQGREVLHNHPIAKDEGREHKMIDGSADLLAFLRAVQEEEQQNQQKTDGLFDEVIIEEVKPTDDGDVVPAGPLTPVSVDELIGRTPHRIVESSAEEDQLNTQVHSVDTKEETHAPANEEFTPNHDKEEPKVDVPAVVETGPVVELKPTSTSEEDSAVKSVDSEVTSGSESTAGSSPSLEDDSAKENGNSASEPVVPVEVITPVDTEQRSAVPEVTGDVHEEEKTEKKDSIPEAATIAEPKVPSATPGSPAPQTKVEQVVPVVATTSATTPDESETGSTTATKQRGPSRFTSNNIKFANRIRNREPTSVVVVPPSTQRPSFSRNRKPVKSEAADDVSETTTRQTGPIRNRFAFRRNGTQPNVVDVTTSKPVEVITTKKVALTKRPTGVRNNPVRTRPNLLRGRSTTTTTEIIPLDSDDEVSDTTAIALSLEEEGSFVKTAVEGKNEEQTEGVIIKPSRFNRLELATESTTTTTISSLEVRMSRLKNRPHLNVSDRPKPKMKPISINDRRTKFTALNNKKTAAEEKETIKVKAEEEEDSVDDDEPVESNKDNVPQTSISSPAVSGGSLTLQSLRSNRKPGQFAARRVPPSQLF